MNWYEPISKYERVQKQLDGATERLLNNVNSLPPHMADGVLRYIRQGIPGGHFLTAVFSNKLVDAYERADESNTRAMRNWAAFLYGCAPSNCWGSEQKVREWIAVGGLKGILEREHEEALTRIADAKEDAMVADLTAVEGSE